MPPDYTPSATERQVVTPYGGNVGVVPSGLNSECGVGLLRPVREECEAVGAVRELDGQVGEPRRCPGELQADVGGYEVQRELPRILAEADAMDRVLAPPMTNRGALPSNAGVDWLSATHGDTTGRIWCDLLGVLEAEWSELESGVRGYPRARAYGSVIVGYGGCEVMGSHISISGSGLRELESEGKVKGWAQFMADCLEVGAKFTRLDFYKDSYDGEVAVEECERKLKLGEVRTRAWDARKIGDIRIGEGEERGETVYIGRRVSNTVVRVYDKAKQLCPRGLPDGERVAWLSEHGPHTRVEVEYKKERAQKVAELIAVRGFAPGLIGGLINSHVEFKEGYARDHNGNRVPTWEAWAQLMGAAEKIVLACGVAKRSLAQAYRWLERQCGVYMAVLHLHYGCDVRWLEEMIRRSYPRFKEKHRRMLGDADAVC